MPITDLEIYSAASVTIKHYGPEAWNHAVERAEILDESGDEEGRDAWVRIANAIREILRKGSLS